MPNGAVAAAKRAIGQFVVAVVRDWCPENKKIIHHASDVTNERLRREYQTRSVLGTYLDLDALLRCLVADEEDEEEVDPPSSSVKNMVDRFWYFICRCVYGEVVWTSAVSSADDMCRDGNLFVKKMGRRWTLNERFFDEKNVSIAAFVDFFRKCAEAPDETFPSYVKVMGWGSALWIYDMPKNEDNGHVEFDDPTNKKRKRKGERARLRRLDERFNSHEK